MILLVLACATEPDLDWFPTSIDLGTVDFAQPMPDEGYEPVTVTITNVGEDEVVLTVAGYDDDHLCLPGFPGARAPFELSRVPGGLYALLSVAACGQLAGDIDQTITSELRLTTTGEPPEIVLPVTFVSTRSDL